MSKLSVVTLMIVFALVFVDAIHSWKGLVDSVLRSFSHSQFAEKCKERYQLLEVGRVDKLREWKAFPPFEGYTSCVKYS